ncbi:hypothetical protein [Micromonospora chersina]|uniref:hypothetical protein n=1 Tax=Micromonospora chersina TaxID=47854 RepID=UPI00371441FD
MVHMELMRDKAREFPQIDRPAAYTSARIWHCSYRTLAPLSRFTGLRTLEIATYPDATLDHLAGLTALEELRVVHLPHVADLAPLARLASLRHLTLATLPSWDSSGKVTEVHSLAPLALLPKLETVHLFGVRPPDRQVDDLLAIASLRRARISKYPKKEIERLSSALASRADE